ncbi:MAG: hypothetical protein ACPG19_09195 [Saprospiraceae bacterium]
MEKATLNATIEKDILHDTTHLLAGQVLDISPVRSRAVVNELDLYDYKKPALGFGEYIVDFKQTVTVDGYSKPAVYDSKVKLKVAQPNKVLSPADIYQMFPPKGAYGKYSTFLPHIILNASTLPWEFPHYDTNATVGTPWLALVIMDEDEGADVVSPGQKVRIKNKVVPTIDDLNYLVHVSKRNKPQAGTRTLDPDAKTEKVVLIANRFPTPGKTNTAYIISLDETPVDKQYTCLFSWNFGCEEAGKDGLKHILENLNVGPLRLPNIDLPSSATDIQKGIATQLKKGFVSLPHQNRMGIKMMSLYRGPLVCDVDFSSAQSQTLLNIKSINSSDQLLRYFKGIKKMDVTYASAWELGKWLTLQNKEVSIELFKWKRAIATALKLKKQKTPSQSTKLTELQKIKAQIDTMFTGANNDIALPDMPERINDWLQELVFLSPLPFNYIIPDERLLPAESMRFFTVDESWLWALVDGALSIGRNPTERAAPPFGAPKLHLSGCLIRTEAISQFPDLKIKSKNFDLIEKRKIGNDIWLCIFKESTNVAQQVDEIELYLPQAGMRFGGEIVEGTLKKELTDNSAKIAIPFRKNKKRVINAPLLFSELVKGSNASKSGQFAYNMIQLSPKVIFNKKKKTT